MHLDVDQIEQALRERLDEIRRLLPPEQQGAARREAHRMAEVLRKKVGRPEG